MESGYKHIQRGVTERGEEQGTRRKKENRRGKRSKRKKKKVARSFLVVFSRTGNLAFCGVKLRIFDSQMGEMKNMAIVESDQKSVGM